MTLNVFNSTDVEAGPVEVHTGWSGRLLQRGPETHRRSLSERLFDNFVPRFASLLCHHRVHKYSCELRNSPNVSEVVHVPSGIAAGGGVAHNRQRLRFVSNLSAFFLLDGTSRHLSLEFSF